MSLPWVCRRCGAKFETVATLEDHDCPVGHRDFEVANAPDPRGSDRLGVWCSAEDFGRLVAATAARTWGPMDQAPRDGTEILVRRKDGSRFIVRWVPWASGEAERLGRTSGGGWLDDAGQWTEADTWQPLPE